MADDLEVGRLYVGTEIDFSGIEQQAKRDLKERVERAAREAEAAVPVTLDTTPVDRSAAELPRTTAAAADKASQTVTIDADTSSIDDALDAAESRAAGAGDAIGDAIAEGAERGARTAAAVTEEQGRQMQAAMESRMDAALGAVSGGAKKQGDESGKRFMRALKQSVARDQADIKEAVARNLMTPEEAARRGREIGKAANDAILAEIERRAKAGTLTDSAFVRLTNGLQGVEAQGKRTAGVLQTAFSRAAAAIGAMFAANRIIGFFGDAWRSADEVNAAARRLEGTARITGISLDRLKASQAAVRDEFKLSVPLAGDLTAEVARLADAAGMVEQTNPAMRAFLEIGAARGMGAAETLQAVRQAVLGIGTGTRALFDTNPAALYAAYAREIGTTADKLDEQAKKQAILTAALRAGANAHGEYAKYLDDHAGKADLARQRMDDLKGEIGQTSLGIRTFLLSAATEATKVVAGLTLMVTGLAAALKEPFVLAIEIVGNPKAAFDRIFNRDRGPLLRDTAPDVLAGVQERVAAGTATDAAGRPYKTPQQRAIEAAQKGAAERIRQEQEAARAAAAAKKAAQEQEAAVKRLTERVREWQSESAAALRVWQQGQDAPAALGPALQAVVAADREIAALEKEIAATRGKAPADALKMLDARRAERTAAIENVQAVRAEIERLTQEGATIELDIDIGAAITKAATTWELYGKAVAPVTAALKEVEAAERAVSAAYTKDERIKATKQLEAAQRRAVKAAADTMAAIRKGAKESGLDVTELNKLVDELAKLLKDAGVNADALLGKESGWAGTLKSVEGLARGVLSVADAMGVLDDRTRRSLQGVIDLAGGIGAVLAKPGDIGAWAQAIGGAVGFLGGIFGGSDAEAHRKHMEGLESQRRLVQALDALRDAVLTDISTSERDAMAVTGDAFMKRWGPVFDAFQRNPYTRGKPLTVQGLTQEDYDFLRDLEEISGLEILDDKGRINVEKLNAAWDAFLSMDVGLWGKGLEGRLDALDYASKIAGDRLGSATERLEKFIATVGEFSPEFAAEFGRIFREEGAEAARAWLEDQAVLFAEGGAAALGAWARGLTPEQIRRVIDAGLGHLGEGGGLIGGAEQTRLSIGITEMQANTLLMYQASQLHHLAGIHALLGGQSLPQITPPSASAMGLAPAAAGSTVLDFGDMVVQIQLPAGANAADAREIGRRAGEGFGDAFSERLAARYRAAGLQRPRILTDQSPR